MTENPIPASDWTPGTLRTHKIGRARRGPIWGPVGGGLFSGRYRTYRPVLLTTGPARATARDGQPVFRFFYFSWVLWRFQVATHNPRSRPVGYATPEVPRALRLRSDCDLVALGRCHGACTPGGTPGPGYASTHAVALPRSLFWQPPPGCGPGRPQVKNAVSGTLRLQVRDLSTRTRGQYAAPAAASPARVGQVPTPPGLQLPASAAEPFEQQAR